MPWVQTTFKKGGRGNAPVLWLKVWLYAHGLLLTSSQRLGQRVKEDMRFATWRGGPARPLEAEPFSHAAPAVDERSISADGESGAWAV